MNKKIFYLLVALALPGLIFIFLKIFGKNHFDIPIYFKDGVGDASRGCEGAYQGQYILSDSSLISFIRNSRACLFVEGSESTNKEISQLREAYRDDQLQIVSLANVDPNRLNQVRKCTLFLHDPWKAVLIDREKRIRGYYAFTNLEETDRLKVEIEILLTND
jgi:hypothetical protein